MLKSSSYIARFYCTEIEKKKTPCGFSTSIRTRFCLDKARFSIVENYKLTCTGNILYARERISTGRKVRSYEIEWVRADF